MHAFVSGDLWVVIDNKYIKVEYIWASQSCQLNSLRVQMWTSPLILVANIIHLFKFHQGLPN